MNGQFDSKAEQVFFETIGKAVKNDLAIQASDNKCEKFRHVPDCVYFDERADGLVFVDFKGGNFPSNVGKNRGKSAAENEKCRYLTHQYSQGSSSRAKARRRNAAATMGWNHSIWQKIRFVESLQPMFPNHAVYYVIVCEGIRKKVKTNVGVAKAVDAFTGQGNQFVVWDTSEFESWVSSNNVEPLECPSVNLRRGLRPYGIRLIRSIENVPFRWKEVVKGDRHLHIVSDGVYWYDDAVTLPKVER